MKACEVIVQERKKQLEECKKDLLKKLRGAIKMDKVIGKVPDESLFREYLRVTRAEGVGDKEATDAILKLLEEAGAPVPLKSVINKVSGGAKKASKKDESEQSRLIWEHREETHEIRRVTKELVARVRSLRYFAVVRDFQRQVGKPRSVSCPGCGRDEVPANEVSVLSSCGHVGCHDCVMACAVREECVYAASGACQATARILNIVKGETLGVDDIARDGCGRHYGRKLEMIIDLIKYLFRLISAIILADSKCTGTRFPRKNVSSSSSSSRT